MYLRAVGRSFRRRRATSSSLLFELASLTFAIAALVVLVFVPIGTSVEAREVTVDPSGRVVEAPRDDQEARHFTLVEHEGLGVLVLLTAPVTVAAVPFAFSPRRRRAARIVAATLLGAFVVLGAASIGMFFLPAAVFMTVAAALGPISP